MAFTFCTNCGEKIDIKAVSCPKCGLLTGVEQKELPNVPFNNQFNMNNVGYNFGQDQNNQNNQNQNPNGNNPYGNPNGNNPYGNQNNNQYGNPYGNQNGNQYGNPYGNQNQNPYGNPYGNQNQNPYGNQQGNPQWNNQQNGNFNPYTQNEYRNFERNMGYNPQNYQNPFNRQNRKIRNLNIGLVIFSIINILLGLVSFVGLCFGIPALINVFNARYAKTDEEEIGYKKLSLALNIVSIVLLIVPVIFSLTLF